jgi:hypothetical protein
MGVKEGLVRYGIIGICLAALGQAAQAKPRTLTYSTAGATAKHVCADISRLSGSPVTVDKRVASEVLVVNVQSVPLELLVERLAEALHAKVVTETRGYRIARSASQQAMLAASQLNEGRAFAKKALLAPRKRLSELAFDATGVATFVNKLAAFANATSPHGFVGYDDRCRWLEDHSPVSRLLDRIVFQRGAEVFALMPVGESTTLSWTVGAQATPFVAEFQKEQGLLTDAVAKQMPNAATIMASTMTDRLAHPKPIPSGSLLTLTLKKRTPAIMQGDLDVMSPSGEHLTSHRTSFEGEKTDLKVWDTYPLGAWAKGLKTFKVPAEWKKERLCAPETHDPLGMLAGAAVVEIGRRTHRQVVACLPDSAKGWADMEATERSIDLKKYLRALIVGADVQITTSASWLVIKPKRAVLCEAERVDRAVLGNYLRSARSAGHISVEALADIRYRTQGRYDDFAGPELREALSLPYEFSGVHQSREFLDVLGAFSSGDRKAILQGKKLLVAAMTDKQRALLRAYWESPSEVDPGKLFSNTEPIQLPPFPSTLSAEACLRAEDRTVESWAFAPTKKDEIYPASPEFMAAADVLVERKVEGWENLAALVYYPVRKTTRTYTVDLGAGVTRSITFDGPGKPNMAAGIERSKMPSAQTVEGKKLRDDYRKLKDEQLNMILREAFMVRYER